MPRQFNVGDQVRLMDRSFGIAVDTTSDQEPLRDPTLGVNADGEAPKDWGLKVFPAYPYEDLPCLDKVGTKVSVNANYWAGDDGVYDADACIYTVLNIDVQALGLTCKGCREDRPLNIAIRSNETGAVIFTNTRFVETPSKVKRVQIVEDNVWDDAFVTMTAAQRREAMAQLDA